MVWSRLIPKKVTLLILLLLLFQSCDRAEGPEPPELRPTFESIQANIFTSSCARSDCHAAPNPPQGLDLSERKAFENLVNISSNEKPEYLRVDPSNPDSSYLIMKLEESEKIIGAQMPFGEEPLSENKIQAIRDWIANGAEP